jgi:hypothetical protein
VRMHPQALTGPACVHIIRSHSGVELNELDHQGCSSTKI